MSAEPTPTEGTLVQVEQIEESWVRLHVSRGGRARAIVEISFGDDDAHEDVLSIYVMRRFGAPGGPYEATPCRLDFETDC
jgi:hypothetical protein